jgi:hypothetical protein
MPYIYPKDKVPILTLKNFMDILMYSKHIHELKNKGVTKKLGGGKFVALLNCLLLLKHKKRTQISLLQTLSSFRQEGTK